jgi:hypothetical protein
MKSNPLNDWPRYVRCLKAYASSWLRAGSNESIESILKSAELADLTWENIKNISSSDNRSLAEELTAIGSESLAARSVRPGEYDDARLVMQSLLNILSGEGSEASLVKAARATLAS